jgi:hypothetical protein
MRVKSLLMAAAVLAIPTATAPAAAQFFFKSPMLAGVPVRGDELGVGLALPEATATEQKAALVWGMRAALNVAALQCDFEPTLHTVRNYNALLTDHSAELKASYDLLDKYFVRTSKGKKAGQDALDKFGTRIYSSFSAVASQYTFCQTASQIGADATFMPRGSFFDFAQGRMRELRNSLLPSGEQRFPGRISHLVSAARLPSTDKRCWKKDLYQADKCGAAY